MSKFIEKLKFLLYIILFIPLFFINVRNSHDWGDDFAHYIHQASNIAEGLSQSSTGYIFNPDNPFIGPPAYTVGFPLLLAPIFKIFGNNILAFNYFNTALLLMAGVLMIVFFKNFFGELIAILLSLIVIYNPWTISFKCEIISDISFTLIFLSTAIIYNKIKISGTNYLLCILCGTLIGLSILIRNIGITILLAILADTLITILSSYKKVPINNTKKFIINVFLITCSSVLIYLLFNNLIFPEGNKTIHYFRTLYSHSGIYETVLKNLTYYIDNFQGFFHPKMILWEFLPFIIKAFALTMFLLGFFNEMLKKVSFLELLLIGYIASICLFPNSTQGFRYLLPLLPFLMYYIVFGIRCIKLARQVNKNLMAVLLTSICLLSYKTRLSQIIKDQHQTLQGPQEADAIEAFTYIKNNTLKTDTIVFIKPRALALYTGRFSFTNHPNQDSASLAIKFRELKPHLFLLMSDIENPALRSYIKSNALNMKLIFKNPVFELYKQSKP